ncbi:heavy metal-binding domain-containing protein [Hymenobacter latericus]|uniref:heavy metal-binding domain-containing protein n=1 Tax=Hymenobacter sp. YIM 151858-1 TaxID=2987688 RepID=UPI002227CBB0|nr:heavy metal-binding domain-containing protein [Hymenobacter sp. YIM 151858-1]UYZ57621.1 hypothetical protein OIS50_11120 [Hymenobacter sp. YIM 151858-1]
MKRTLLPILPLLTFIWTTSCSSDNSAASGNAPAAAGHQHAAGEGHEPAAGAEHSGGHMYACPMHPEVTSEKPGTCPKCGMTLKRTDQGPADGIRYRMNFAATPAQPAAGQSVTLSFRPQVVGNEQTPVPLAVVHEKQMHLIIVSKDLSEFYHEHPELKASARYEVPFTFKTGGTYLLYQDYQPENNSHQLGRQTLQVSGPTRPAVKFEKDQLRWQKDGYAAALSFDKAVQVGRTLGLIVTVSRGGRPVTDLDNYLGALGHMVVLSEDGSQYLHVHPQESSTQGPAVGFHTSFEKPGRYRVFLQFKHGGTVQTADFTVTVAPAAA